MNARAPTCRRLGGVAARHMFSLIAVLAAALLAGCQAGAGIWLRGASSGQVTLTVAAVDNPQMEDLQKVTPEFTRAHPNIQIRYVLLPEDQLRQQVTQDIATSSGRYDLATIGTYETPLWARVGWLENLQPYIQKDSSYAPADLIPEVARALQYRGSLYGVPFYGESSFLMYRKDLLRQAGVTMPQHPTWNQVAEIASRVNDPARGVYGICLRGLPGWGEQLAPLDTVVNTFGGRWFDMRWNPQLTSPAFAGAVSFYVNLIKVAGEPGAASQGFTECLNTYNGGHAAMWYDATSGASDLTGAVAQNTGYAFAPTRLTRYSGWLWAWALGMPVSGKHKDAAWTFMDWATSPSYARLVGEKLGWQHVPPGTRTSTYQLRQYQQVAGFASLTLQSIQHADVNHATVDPVPYAGIQYVDIPEFQQLGTEVSQQIAAAIVGNQSVPEALRSSQQFASSVAENYQ